MKISHSTLRREKRNVSWIFEAFDDGKRGKGERKEKSFVRLRITTEFFFSLSLPLSFMPRFRSRYGSGHPASGTATPLWRSTRRNARLSTDTTINARVAERLRVRFRSSPICLVEAGRPLPVRFLARFQSFFRNQAALYHAHARRYIESSPTLAPFN